MYTLRPVLVVFFAIVVLSQSRPCLAQPGNEPMDLFSNPSTLGGDTTDDALAEDATVSDANTPNQELSNRNDSPSRRNGSHWLGRNKFIRSHWVRLTPTGDLKGKINLLRPDGGSDGVASLTVSIYRKGEKLNEVQTNEAGDFVVPGLSTGVYSLIARGASGFAAYGLHALSSTEDAQVGFDYNANVRLVQAVEVKETLEISTAAVPPTFNQLKSILSRDFSRIRSNFVPAEEYTNLLQQAEQQQAPGASEVQGAEKLRGTKELEKNIPDKTKSEAATSLSVHDVPLETYENGLVLRGRLYGIDPDSGRSVEIKANSTTVTLIQNDRRVAKTPVRDEGEFDFYGLQPGIYSLVAIGDGGFGAVAFRAVEPEQALARGGKPEVHLVQANPRMRGLGNNIQAFPFAMALIDDPRAIQDAVQPLQPMFNEFAGEGMMLDGIIQGGALAPPALAPPAATMGAPIQNAGFSPTSSVGGGGGGIGGIGGIGGVVGGIAGITALGVRDRRPVSPASPAGPVSTQAPRTVVEDDSFLEGT